MPIEHVWSKERTALRIAHLGISNHREAASCKHFIIYFNSAFGYRPYMCALLILDISRDANDITVVSTLAVPGRM